ncbi:MAG: hypothetical protein ACFFD2_02820 [Promethearchaeota archaeon]
MLIVRKQFRTQMFLEKSTIVVVPIINRVGYFAEARACPRRGLEVEYKDRKVIIKDDEKHMFKFPLNWQDPNRGWDENDTLVKHHFMRLNNIFSPKMIIFNHNWDIPQGKIHVYASLETFKSISNIRKIFARFYHTHNIFGQLWSFMESINEKDAPNFSYIIMQKFGIPIFLTETYVYSDESPKIHLALNLFLIVKFLKIPLDDDILVEEILEEVEY